MTDPAFHPVTLEDGDAVRAACLLAQTPSCQYNFANLYCLRNLYGTEIALGEHSALLVRQTRREPGTVSYLPPLNAPWETLLALARSEGRPWSLFGVTAEDRAALEQCAPGAVAFQADRDWAEYLYTSAAMTTLSGGKLGQRRRDARQCRDTWGERLQAEPMTPENFDEVFAFQKRWMESRGTDDAQREHLDGETIAVRDALDHYEQLQLQGLVLRLDGAVAAYSYGCAVGGVAFDIITQKADVGVRHLYRVIFQDVARMYGPDYRWINMEEDLGVPGLRRMKSLYQPDVLLEKWRAGPGERL